MKPQFQYCFVTLFLWISETASLKPEKPNIVIIMADDMGFADMGLNNAEFATPNLDALALNGVLLNKFYTPPVCSPSRSALVTGKYPIHTGMQHLVIAAPEPWGLGLNERTIYEIFRDAGYSTNLVGKWHLGMFKKEYVPTNRGVERYFGNWGPKLDYWDHTFWSLPYSKGLDLRDQDQVALGYNGTYATDLYAQKAVQFIDEHDKCKPMLLVVSHLAPHAANFNDDLQAPESEVRKFEYIKDERRRKLAAMVSRLDNAVGETVEALERNGMLENTVILFYSDNGAPTVGDQATQGSNSPLRGQKNSPWEGGMRVSAAMWAANIDRNRVVKDLFHVTDILPTLATAAKVDLGCYGRKIDGLDQWASLKNRHLRGPRTQMLYNIDDDFGYQAIQEMNYKLVNGTTINGTRDGYLGEFIFNTTHPSLSSQFAQIVASKVHRSLSRFSQKTVDLNFYSEFFNTAKVTCQKKDPSLSECEPLKKACLFKIDEDPCETNNLAETPEGKEIVKFLLQRVEDYRRTQLPQRNQPKDPKSDPKYYNFTWVNWVDIYPTIPGFPTDL